MFIKYVIKLKRSSSLKQTNKAAKLSEVLRTIYNRAFNILISKNEKEDCLVLPGCHELLESLGESHCVLLSENLDVYESQAMLSLFESKIEYEMNFVKGLCKFLKVEQVSESFSKSLFESFQSNMLKPIINWECIQNRLHLKTVKTVQALFTQRILLTFCCLFSRLVKRL